MSNQISRKAQKPTIRIVRSLARSGGTLIGKCIGCMDKVNLISEIHPANLSVTSPMMQAHEWFGLITKKDIARFKVRPPSMLQFVTLCDMRSSDRNEVLVLRDWTHLDYIGVPYTKPEHGFKLSDSLSEMYDIRNVVTTRHPVDQYLSLLGLPIVAQSLDLDAYLHGCLRFAQHAKEHGFYRYEDFTNDPTTVLKLICKDLDLEFDENYKDKWSAYTTITGDTQPGLGRGSTKREIQSLARKPIDETLLSAIRSNLDYQESCKLLGYEP
jgi:protein O-GlcNAc transferase